jgi:hypothetical protein
MKRCCLLLGSFAALGLALQEARGAPLDADACGKLNGERLQLEFGGARNNLAKGPDWAKSNLSPDAINQVRRLIEIDGQMLFRCTGFNLVNLSADPDPDPDPPAGLNKEDDDAPAKAEPKPKAKQKTSKGAEKDAKAAPAAKTPAAKEKPAEVKGKGADNKSAAKPAPAPRPKAKTDDAYRPPQAKPNTDPFAGKAQPAAK